VGKGSPSNPIHSKVIQKINYIIQSGVSRYKVSRLGSLHNARFTRASTRRGELCTCTCTSRGALGCQEATLLRSSIAD
jgi:hypothetical protein